MSYLRVIGGGALYLWCVLRERGVYRGGQRFYALAQADETRRGRLAVAALTSPPAVLALSYRGYLDARGHDRLSPMAAAQYMQDDSLSGYADEDFDKGGATLLNQQRGLILPLLETVCEELPDGGQVAEIGAGNGDVLAYLAERHPRLSFVGVDFSVAVAKRKHQAHNLTFTAGYALDLLETGELAGDVVFASSTFIVFTPLELERYVRALAAAGFTRVLLNEPTWAGLEQTASGPAVSQHLEGATWHHNYAGYLAAGGFTPAAFSFEAYQPPGSQRPDVRVLLLDAQRAATARECRTTEAPPPLAG